MNRVPAPFRRPPTGAAAVVRALLPAVAVLVLALTAAAIPGAVAADAAPAEPPAGWKLDGDADAGRTIFQKRCTVCHGAEGKGDGRIKTDPAPRDLTDADALKLDSDWQLYQVIKGGGEAVGLSGKMIPWRDMLADQEVHDVAAYVKSLSSAD